MRWRAKLYKTDRARDFDHERDRNVRARQIYETIDRQSFQWVVVLVAGVGFFLDGYTLFASTQALPMISFVYWRDDTTSHRTLAINIATLAGTMMGQILFGFLADKLGRKKMYGAELLLLIASTLGVAMSSSGAHNSMNIFAWLVWWRIVVGIGVGADYPLSAVITSELAPTKHRARMLASVFFMQPLGQISGNVVSLIVVAVSRNQGESDLTRSVDIMWRWVVGFGVIPGVIAVLFRFAIPETPRFLLDIEDDPITAEFDASNLFGDTSTDTELEDGTTRASSMASPSQATNGQELMNDQADWNNITGSTVITLNSNWTLSKRDIIQYFWQESNWKTLAGVSLCWLLLDFGFYGLGLSSPQFLAKTWGSLRISGPTPSWKIDDSPDANVYDMFFNTSVHALVILNTGSFVGGLLMILFASNINRVSLQKYGFCALAALFIAMGVTFVTVHREGPVAIVLYVLCQVFFNFGPNGTTYILPAELFPTRYRATAHGIAAGSGKLGSILVQLFSTYFRLGSSSPGDDETRRFGSILLVFSVIMLIGAAVTHFWIPDVQQRGKGKRRYWGGKTKTLEELAMGRAGSNSAIVVRGRRRRDIE